MASTNNIGAETTKGRWRTWHYVLLGFGVLAVFIAVLLFTVFSFTRPVVEGADVFMAALRDEDYESAYARTSPALQAQLISPQEMRLRFTTMRPASWSWNSRRIVNDIGEVGGSVTLAQGGASHAQMQLQNLGGEWRVIWFRIDPP